MSTHGSNQVDVSIVIVCMNYLDHLRKCLDGIYAHTHDVSFEIWIVAYLFSQENLAALQREYPDVHVVESNEVRGFAENNNLALRQANGEFCFIVNDDTFMDMPVIDKLWNSFRQEPRAGIFSPKILNPDGSVQFCGDPPRTMRHWLLFEFKLRRYIHLKSCYVNGEGIFRTYNVMGAAFMVRSSVIQELGYLDERYFFAPEDTAFSTLANERGYACYVNADVRIYHTLGASLGRNAVAAIVAMQRGHAIFLSRGSAVRWLVYATAMFLLAAGKVCYWSLRRVPDRAVRCRVWRAAMLTAFSRCTPKELFLRYFQPAALEDVETVESPCGQRVWS